MPAFFKYLLCAGIRTGGENQQLCAQRAVTIGQVRTRMSTFFYIFFTYYCSRDSRCAV